LAFGFSLLSITGSLVVWSFVWTFLFLALPGRTDFSTILIMIVLPLLGAAVPFLIPVRRQWARLAFSGLVLVGGVIPAIGLIVTQGVYRTLIPQLVVYILALPLTLVWLPRSKPFYIAAATEHPVADVRGPVTPLRQGPIEQEVQEWLDRTDPPGDPATS